MTGWQPPLRPSTAGVALAAPAAHFHALDGGMERLSQHAPLMSQTLNFQGLTSWRRRAASGFSSALGFSLIPSRE